MASIYLPPTITSSTTTTSLITHKMHMTTQALTIGTTGILLAATTGAITKRNIQMPKK